ncbi:hypothetical protein [Croceimicrobium hydrocarbonivorans]|uniref:Uncharacterized protein n=1 Tax=Croceimicrobium hydrocarbonivorans TaxID=2761580 RepID=A0A7H0VG27_9FLAO|nr:hypothetical protein [Croceimicrobium hydrocarbonivorans]QNR24675.1 hypothetical protein H4K34_02190 [Croceimicrobium hydrocarbonivorans]
MNKASSAIWDIASENTSSASLALTDWIVLAGLLIIGLALNGLAIYEYQVHLQKDGLAFGKALFSFKTEKILSTEDLSKLLLRQRPDRYFEIVLISKDDQEFPLTEIANLNPARAKLQELYQAHFQNWNCELIDESLN